MNSQLYTAASGLIAEQRRLDLIGSNLANVSTSAYRPTRAFSAEYRRIDPQAGKLVRAANAAVAVAGTFEIPGRGPVRQTGRELDVALPDGALMTVETTAGPRYTRSGDLQVNADGVLTDNGGNPLLQAKREKVTGLGPNARIAADGRVLDGDNEVGRLELVRDPQAILLREKNGLLTARGNEGSLEIIKEPAIQPGWLEGSGTRALGELVQLIEAQRAFETYQKLVTTTMNDVNRKTVNDLAG
jgi:flagellar basal body rod protein FlgG